MKKKTRIVKFKGRDIKVPDDATEAEEIEIIESFASEQNPSVENETAKLNPDGSPNVLGRLTDDLGWAGATTAKAVGSGLADTGGLAIDAASYIPIPEFTGSQHENVDELLGEYGASRDQRQAARDKFNKENDGTLFNTVRGATNLISGAAAPFAIGKNLVKASQYFGKAEPYARRLGEAIKTQGMGGKASGTGGSGYVNRIAGGGIGGAAATGVVDPEYLQEGAIAGSLFPAVGRLGSQVFAGTGNKINELKEFVKAPWSHEGQEFITGKVLNESVGMDDALKTASRIQRDRQQVKRIKGTAEKLSFLPTNDPILTPRLQGSKPTVATILKTPAFSSLEKSSIKTPQAAEEYEKRLLANNKARLDEFKNTIPDEEAAIAARTEGTEGLYNTAKEMPVITTEELKNLFKRPSMKLALKGAKERAKEMDSTFDIENLTGESVQHMNWALKQMEKPRYWEGAKPLDKLDYKLISDTRKKFLNLIESQPQFDKVAGSPLSIADKEYEKLSLPIGQSRILKKVLEDSMDDKGYGTIDLVKLQQGLTNENASKILNRFEIKLDDVLTREQRNKLGFVGKDLQDLDYAQQGGNILSGGQNADISNPVTIAGVPNAMRGLSAYNLGLNIMRIATKDKHSSVEREIQQMLSKALREPAYAARLMRNSTKPIDTNLLGQILKGMESATNTGLTAGARGVPAAIPEYKRTRERSKQRSKTKYDLTN